MQQAQERVDALKATFVEGWQRRHEAKRPGAWIHRRSVSPGDKAYYAAVAELDRITTDLTYYCSVGGFVYTAGRGDGHKDPIGERPSTPNNFWMCDAFQVN